MNKYKNYDYAISDYPSKTKIDKYSTKVQHITIWDENKLRMRVNVDTGEIVAKEVK